MNCLFVFLGGGLGCVSRYFINEIFYKFVRHDYIIPTIISNFIGCFVMGLLFFFFIDKVDIPEHYKIFFTTGFCGGISTLSGVSLDTIKMFQNGKIFDGIIYIIITFSIALIATLLGFYIQKNF